MPEWGRTTLEMIVEELQRPAEIQSPHLRSIVDRVRPSAPIAARIARLRGDAPVAGNGA